MLVDIKHMREMFLNVQRKQAAILLPARSKKKRKRGLTDATDTADIPEVVRDVPNGDDLDANEGGMGRLSPWNGWQRPTPASFGSAGHRTKEQNTRAEAYAARSIASIKPNTIICYTDGACHGNPGPCGTGAVVLFPGGEERRVFAALGEGSNNIAEMCAFRMCARVIMEARAEGVATQAAGVCFLSDSNYCVGILVSGHRVGSNISLVQSTKKDLSKLKRELPWDILWVPGHAGVEGNEAADALATLGAQASAAALMLSVRK